MTCIAAVTDGKTVWMGGDSAATSGWDLDPIARPKVFRNGEFLIGGTGDLRALQLLEHAFSPPPIKEGQSVERYFVVDFVNTLRDCLKSAGYAERHDEKEKQDSLYLIGFRGRLMRLDPSYCAFESTRRYAAIGCGGAHAEGVLFATEVGSPHWRITKSLECAESHSAGVRGPFAVLSTMEE